ncbi:MAG: EamA family transporter [Oscillospiraceae bacterium]|nr:EamA family transporter [Oscillospiraceae bacterium]
MKERGKLIFYISIVAAAILWGTIGLFFQFLSEYNLSRMEIVFVRTIVAAVLLLLYLLIFDRGKLKIRWQDLWMFLGTGVASLLFFNYCYFSAMEYTSLSVAAVLLYTAPAFVTILSAIFFKDRFTGRKILALILTIPGCAVISGVFSGLVNGSFSYSSTGILFGLGSGFGYALYTIFSRIALRRYDSITISFYTFVLAGIGSGLLCSPIHVASRMSSPPALLLGIGIAAATCLIPYLLYTYGLTRIGNSEASITATIEPLAATCISVFILGEPFTLEKLIGIVLILGAVLIINLPDRSHHASDVSAEPSSPIS